MGATSDEKWSEVKSAVEKWFLKLQSERKCNSTNTVSKIVIHSCDEIQESVRELISRNINAMVRKCILSGDLADIQNACNTINGCFDNFIHAAEGVRYSFDEVIKLIDFALDRCQLELPNNGRTVIVVLELMHSLSRILILILKLRKTGIARCENSNIHRNKFHNSEEINGEMKDLLSSLTTKLGLLLIKENILIDTKNNFAISGILIRELLMPNEEELIKYHKQFLATLPDALTKQKSKLHLLQFFISGAIINTWSTNIIDEEATCTYLKFFIKLCENYSSETPIILNTSRTLSLLVNHKCFKEFLEKRNTEIVSKIMKSLLSCVFMLLEHPVACVRYSAKDFLHLLASHSSLQSYIIDSAFELPTDKRSYFITLATLASQVQSRILIKKNNDLPRQLLDSLYDPTIVSHVSFAIENMILNDSFAEDNFSEWCETWIIPLLISLKSVLPIVAAEIEKLLEKAFKKYPNSILYITEKWKQPKSENEIRCIITALKISHKKGFKFKANNSAVCENKVNCSDVENKSVENNSEKNCQLKLISEKLLKHCLHQGDDEIRISAFSLIVEASKTTQPYSKSDFQLIIYFLKYNLNNHQPATRQKLIALIQKMLVRFSDSKAAFQRGKMNLAEKEEYLILYDQFLNSLIEFCFANIFVRCNFNRLNSVLNILLLCFKTIKGLNFNVEKTNYYWNKFLIALDSSYEENKELVVILSKKLDFSLLNAAEPQSAKLLFEKSFSLIAHMEPPDVLTGSYLLQILIYFPSSKEILLKYFIGKNSIEDGDVQYYCIRILTEKLKNQVFLAKLDLMTAATCGPMYGTLFAIRLLLKDVHFSWGGIHDVSNESEKSSFEKWKKILNDLVEICFEMISTVAAVVNSSSPEGHLPMDFQTNFEKLIINDSPEGSDNNGIHLTALSNFMEEFKKIESALENSNCDLYETHRKLKCLLKENKLLISKFGTRENGDFINRLSETKDGIEKLIGKMDENNSIVDWPATAQVLLLCAWRSIKEASLYLGDFVSKLPIEIGVEIEFFSQSTIIRIGEELKLLLCEIKHRGSFEHVYVAFTRFVNSLWKCANSNLSNLPRQWLDEIVGHFKLPIRDQTLKLCSTRRSAGLPFLIQAVICSEILSVKSSTPSSLHSVMKSLLEITENGVEGNSESKIHALNVLRALFKHAQLGEHVSSYVSKALMAAIRGSRGSSWPERNSSNLLFSSLVIRIFGVSRSRQEVAKKNRMTSRTFFQRYSELYDFLLSEMKLVHSTDNQNSRYPKPSLYLVLLILGRLYPTPREDPDTLDLSEFLPFINKSRRNPTMKIRELAARALVPLIPADKLINELDNRFLLLASAGVLPQNEYHGILLQIMALLRESSCESLENLNEDRSKEKESLWIEKTDWILKWDRLRKNEISFVVASVYVKMLHLLFKKFHWARGKITRVVLTFYSEAMDSLSIGKKGKIGLDSFVENFFFLTEDALGYDSIVRTGHLRTGEEFFDLFLNMLNSDMEEIQLVPLKILRSILFNCRPNGEIESKSDGDEFGGPPSDLFVFQKKENVEELRREILIRTEIANSLIKRLNDEGNVGNFNSKSIRRLRLKAVRGFVTEGLISGSCFAKLKIESLEKLMRSRDKEISSDALVIYAVCIVEKFIDGEKIGNGERGEKLAKVSAILKNFSSSDSDVEERLAVSKIMNRCFDNLIEKELIDEMNLWMIPIKLLLDEDPTVRMEASNFVSKMQAHVTRRVKKDGSLIEMEILDWPICNLVSLKAQEFLLDSYVNVFGEKNRLNLIVHMLILALSSVCDGSSDGGDFKDEFGVFEKGNPNPYCEELMISNLICGKLSELKKSIDFEILFRTNFNESLSRFVSESFRLANYSPANLMELIPMICANSKDDKNEFSVFFTQKNNLILALDLKREMNV